MEAAIIQATPPRVPIPAPIAASSFTKMGSDKYSKYNATVVIAAAIVQSAAAIKFQTSALTSIPAL